MKQDATASSAASRRRAGDGPTPDDRNADDPGRRHDRAAASRSRQAARRDRRGRVLSLPVPRSSVDDEPARVVHALRGEGSVRPAGQGRTGPAPATDNASADAAGRRPPRHRRPAARRRRHRSTPAAARRLRDDHFNGKPQQLQVKRAFPKASRCSCSRSLKKKQAKIGVAGGSFERRQAVTLKLGKKVTLVNTATGVRYVLKLVYTGAQPEVIEGFTTAPATASRRRRHDGRRVQQSTTPRHP